MTKENYKERFPILKPLIDEMFTYVEAGDVLIYGDNLTYNPSEITIWQGIHNIASLPYEDGAIYNTYEIVNNDGIPQGVFNQRVRAATFIASLQIESFREDYNIDTNRMALCNSIVSVENENIDYNMASEIAEMTNTLTNGFLQRGMNNGII